MKDIVEQAKKDGYVETLFNRRRYIPELSSNNYMVRQFGARAAMNTPIQGTAATTTDMKRFTNLIFCFNLISSFLFFYIKEPNALIY